MKFRFYLSVFCGNLRGATLCAVVFFTSSLMAAPSTSVLAKKPVKVLAKSRLVLKSQANQMAAGIRAAETALTAAELAIAEQVELGRVQCELGASVTVAADTSMPGFFDVHGMKFRFRMAPVVTSTGAIRLEDAHTGAVWLQLSNKSMLMNQKTGSRLADACVTPAQALVAAAMEISPPLGLLDGPPVVQPSTVPIPDPLTSIAIQ